MVSRVLIKIHLQNYQLKLLLDRQLN